MNNTSLTEIFVNDQPVNIAGHHVNGLHIKDSALEQGVLGEIHDLLTKLVDENQLTILDEEEVHVHRHDRFLLQKKTFEILVNERPVSISKHKVSGLEIKQSAISQGVQIQLDFVLSLELGDRRSKIVGDNDHVHAHRHSRFIAVAPDDNS